MAAALGFQSSEKFSERGRKLEQGNRYKGIIPKRQLRMVMLKLTMNSRKRSKRAQKSFPRSNSRRKLRTTTSLGPEDMDIYQDEDHKDMIGDNLRSMLRQEGSGQYDCVDYLSMSPWQQHVYQITKRRSSDRYPKKEITNETRIDAYCREQIVEWSFRVVDYFRIDREVVALSISFLDRFLATCRCDRTSFKLAATTTLNLAVKLLYPCKLGDLGILSDLSRGEFDMADVAEMENYVLRSLSWRLHPPTAIAFATLLLDYVFCDAVLEISQTDLDDLYDVSSFFSDLAVCDYFFVTMKSSSIAIASILNALEGMFGPDNRLDPVVLKTAKRLGMPAIQDLSAARNRLWELYERSEECALHNNKVVTEEQNQWHGGIFVKKMSTLSSPVSISGSCHSGAEIEAYHQHHKHSQVIRSNTSW